MLLGVPEPLHCKVGTCWCHSILDTQAGYFAPQPSIQQDSHLLQSLQSCRLSGWLASLLTTVCACLPCSCMAGNCDIKNLTRGCKVYFPVFVEGANLSMGDMHFSQVCRHM